MIISHRHQFIFIKTKKTAGTSIEISLSRYCDPSDIITPFEVSDELLRKDFCEPRNYGRLRAHSTASQALQHIGRKKFDQYYKFCFEREPFDKIISYYHYYTSVTGTHWTLREFTERVIYRDVYDFPLYTIGQKVVADVYEYRSLKSDLTEICKKIGIDFDGWLPSAKSQYRPDKTSPSLQQFSPDHIADIRNMFQSVIKLMDYHHPKTFGASPLGNIHPTDSRY